jgi:PIN domain nuclease of toxin-antitoxin system
MKLLLDTHVWLWMLSTPERLNDAAQVALADTGNELWLSVASAWEVAIKHARGKLPLSEPVPALVQTTVEKLNVSVLPISLGHALASATLPPHHHDPFDRLLVAQARAEGLTLVTGDELVSRYGGTVMWAV